MQKYRNTEILKYKKHTLAAATSDLACQFHFPQIDLAPQPIESQENKTPFVYFLFHKTEGIVDNLILERQSSCCGGSFTNKRKQKI